MDRWIALFEGVTGPKLRYFAKLAGCPEAEALGILNYVWLWARNGNADSSGLLKKADLDDIAGTFALKIEKGRDPLEIAKALIEAGWIDEYDGVYYIHDWHEHQKPLVEYLAKKEAAAERKRRERARKALADGNQGEKQVGDPEKLPPEPPGDPPVEPPRDDPPGETKEAKKPAGSQYTPAFEQFWEAYPRKDEKANAYKKYKARLNDGFSEEELLRAAMAYAAQCKKLQTEKHYIKLAKTFLSESTPFVDFLREGDAPGHRPTGSPAGEYHYDPGDTSGSL